MFKTHHEIMKTEQLNMDSTSIDGVDTQVNGRKTACNFPLSFLDFLNSKAVGTVTSKNVFDGDHSKSFNTQDHLENDKNDKETALSSLIGKETSTNVCDSNQSKGFTTQEHLEKDKKKTAFSLVDKEASDLDGDTLSEDDDFLPTYKSLFERIKRHSSDDNLFKCSPRSAMPGSKLESAFFDDSGTSASQNETNCESDVDDETKTRHNIVSPAKFESMNTTEASRSVLELKHNNVLPAKLESLNTTEASRSVLELRRNSIPPAKFQLLNTTEASWSVLEHNTVSPAKFEVLNATETSKSVRKLVLKTVANDGKSENQRVAQYGSLNMVRQLVEPPGEQLTSLVGKVANHALQSDGGTHEEASETPSEIQLADLQRICYKAMIFQQTGQVPMDCDGNTMESCYEEHDPTSTPKNPCPCLCRFYCKKKCKKDQTKLSPKRPCQIGKGYASDKRNHGHSSCACKILPKSKVAKKTLQTKVGESSSAKSAGVIEENVTVDKTILRNRKRVGKIEEPNSHDEIATKYFHDLTTKTRLLAKLELSEQKLKHLANYDASLPFFSGVAPVDEDGIRDASILSLSDDDSIDEKENITNLNRIQNLGGVIDLTDDSPPKSPLLSGSHKFNQIRARFKLGIKADPEGEMSHQTNRIHKPTLGRYGSAMGAIYTSKADPEEEMLLQTNRRRKPTVGRYGVAMGAVYTSDSNDDCDVLNDYKKERETSHKISKSKDTLKNSRKSIYVCDSDEDSRHKVLNPVTSKHLHQKESDKSDRIGVNNDEWLYRPVASCSKDNLPVSENKSNPRSASSLSSVDGFECRDFTSTNNVPISVLNDESNVSVSEKNSNPHSASNIFSVDNFEHHDFTTTNNFPTSLLNDDESTSHSVLDWKTPSSGTTYADLLASYAAYDSDDGDRMSFTMGSPGSPKGSECLDNEVPPVLIKSETAELEHKASVVEIDDVGVLTSLPSTSDVSGIALSSTRVLRLRTTPRITQTMMLKRRRNQKDLISPTLPETPVNNAPASRQSVSKQRERPRKKSCLQLPDAMNNSIEEAEVAVVTGAVNGNDESTPERAQLEKEITAMASQLKQVSALAARAAELEKLALDAKHKESLAVQRAQEANEKLKEERLERIKLLKEAEEKAKVDKAEEERKARELEKEKERAAREVRGKAWECPVCFEPRTPSMQLSVTPCGHVFCKPCITEVGLSNGHCPLCNQAFSEAQVTPLFFNCSF